MEWEEIGPLVLGSDSRSSNLAQWYRRLLGKSEYNNTIIGFVKQI